MCFDYFDYIFFAYAKLYLYKNDVQIKRLLLFSNNKGAT
jgi:hypothetical protein